MTITEAIQQGDVNRLRVLLSGNPEIVKGGITDTRGVCRSLLHIATDWPGHFPNVAATIATLIAAGADVNATIDVPGRQDHETPLHWAASSDDVAAIDALLDGGADIEAPGAIFTGGTAMSDAVVFAQWNAARRLLARGARTTLWQAAALGLRDRVVQICASDSPSPAEITNALWHACRGGQQATAADLLERGGDLYWVGHDRKTPLDVARESGNEELTAWLRSRDAKRADAT